MKINFNHSFFSSINESLKLKKELFNESKNVHKIVSDIFNKIKKGGKIFLCGNGGSAADAQHLAAEFLIRLRPHINRKPIAAISLAQDTSTLTACSNDYNFNKIFSRNLEALEGCKKLDLCNTVFAIATYHKIEHLFEIPLMLHELVPCHKLLFRSYGEDWFETIAYAVPEHRIANKRVRILSI